MANEKSLPVGRRAVVLLSGGLDSATTLYIAKKQGFQCFCLIFDYGQRHVREIQSAKAIAKSARCIAQVVKITLPWKGSSLLDIGENIPLCSRVLWFSGSRIQKLANSRTRELANEIPSTYVPSRNIIFLSFALSYAEAIKAEAIFIGVHTYDYSGYPDCRPEFYRAFDKVVTTGTKSGVEKRKIKIITPLIHKTKAGIIRQGKRLGVPFELTWSCYRGQSKPCGECDSCYFRTKGFREAGLKDPCL